MATKVTFITSSGGHGRVQYGGAETLLDDLLPWLHERGIHVVLVSPLGRLSESLRSKGIDVVTTPVAKKFDLRYLWQLLRILKNENPCVVSLHLQNASFHGRIVARLLKIPHLSTLHNNLREIEASEGRSFRSASTIFLDRWLARLCRTTVVAVSETDFASLAYDGFSPTLIRNGLPKGWSVSADRNTSDNVGFLGRLEFQKGFDRFMEMAAASPHRKFLVGGRGSIEPVGENVEYLGEIEDRASFFARIKVLVVPSRWESFGRVALEGYASGLTVIHSAVGGLQTHQANFGEPRLIPVAPWTLAGALNALAQSNHTLSQDHGAWLPDVRQYSFSTSAGLWLQTLRRVSGYDEYQT